MWDEREKRSRDTFRKRTGGGHPSHAHASPIREKPPDNSFPENYENPTSAQYSPETGDVKTREKKPRNKPLDSRRKTREMWDAMYLDLHMLPCTEPDASFETVSSQKNRDRLGPERKMDVRFYDSELYQKAVDISRTIPTKPIGIGIPGQVMNIHGRKFEWTEENLWLSEHLTNSVTLHPTTDRTDTENVIRVLARIESNILARGLAGREPIHFHLGGNQHDPEKPKVASAVDYRGKHIHLFAFATNTGGQETCGDQSHMQSHMVAPQLVGLGCPLENMILHEIGHLIEPLLEFNIPRMERTFSKGILESRNLLEKISPKYLGKQYEGILEQVRVLNKALRDGRETILVGPKLEKVKTIHYHAEWTSMVTREVTAECIREYYLKPCLTGQKPTEEKTGWDELDEFIHRLCREARITMTKEPAELFPERRENRQPRLVETIQDCLNP
jgi:hypothetical protein